MCPTRFGCGFSDGKGELPPMRPSQVQFGPVARRYLDSGVHASEAALQRLVSVARPDGGCALDVATGAGHAAFALSPHVDHVIASDITEPMLRLVLDEAAARKVRNLRATFALAEALPFAARSFDGIVCRLGAHHFDDPRAFVSESARALKPGAWFVLVDNVGLEDRAADDLLDQIERGRDPSHVRCWTETQWRQWLGEEGLAIETLERTPRPLNLTDWFDRMDVPREKRAEVTAIIDAADGWLREHLRPHGEGDLRTFHLHELTVRARRT